MRILILDDYYEPAIQHFYTKNPEARYLSYEKGLDRLLSYSLGTSNYYSRNLVLLGHQAREIITNDKVLQLKWAKEHHQKRCFDWLDGVRIPFTQISWHSHWQTEILEEQIIQYKPDILYCQNLNLPGPTFLKRIKKKLPLLVVGQVASKIVFDKTFLSPYDLILSSFPHFVKRFKQIGVESRYFPIAFEPSILTKLHRTKKQYNISFVGSFSRHHGSFSLQNSNGTSMLEDFSYLAKKTRVDFWGHGGKYIPKDSVIRKTYHLDAKWGIDMFNVLYNSKITLNRHIDVAENHANNMRLFEATGVGTMLLTDYKSDLHKLFIPGKEVETYKNKEELAAKVEYYLAHPKEREKIAKAGQRKTLNEHTYQKRMKDLIKILKQYQ